MSGYVSRIEKLIGGIGLLYIIVIFALVIGYFLNIYNVVKEYPPVAEWQAPQVVCTVGIVIGPIGGVCGLVDGGVPKKKG